MLAGDGFSYADIDIKAPGWAKIPSENCPPKWPSSKGKLSKESSKIKGVWKSDIDCKRSRVEKARVAEFSEKESNVYEASD